MTDITGREYIYGVAQDANGAPYLFMIRELVRCKDCRHRDLFSCPLTDNDFQKDEDFCSWGEHKGSDDK